ncbi:hypothetical protein GCK72_002217 [Caenorhabditis remanei]|uniref:RING-type domain-containing protein n=1 Tax=Caenorhabditis remanei TaxID=31234 RepID=A0A6A5HRS7_CAERE|nr:hypothetical protein GCK72_002217 [Caenorhabditis remanei]KAF1770399.1 hypothetical protein GCK72_002217 [Caenorhabditis remanei]
MDDFDMDFEEQLDRLNQLQDELRAEIHMNIELNVGNLDDQFGMDQLDADQPDGNVDQLLGRNRMVGGNDPQEDPGNIDLAGNGEERIPLGEHENPAPQQGDNPNGQGEAAVAGVLDAKSFKNKVKEELEGPILTEKGTEMRGFSCVICYDSFNTGKRTPKVFPCGHTFCLSCVKGLMTNRSFLSSSTVICPTCRQNTRFSTGLGAEKIPTNFSVLSMLEQRKEEKLAVLEEEMLECSECKIVYEGTEVTLCNEDNCQDVTDKERLKLVDNIKRSKCHLKCRLCIEKNHSRHNFISFDKVATQYEACRKIRNAETSLTKALKAADDALINMELAKTEIIEHRRRMGNALVNIRAEADHPLIYEYLNRFTTSVKASEDLFKRLIGDLYHFDLKSKARYYRAFGNDTLRPISVVQRDEMIKPKIEQQDEPNNLVPPRDRAPQAINRLNRNGRINIFGPFPAPRNRPAGGILADGVPNMAAMIDHVMQQLEMGGENVQLNVIPPPLLHQVPNNPILRDPVAGEAPIEGGDPVAEEAPIAGGAAGELAVAEEVPALREARAAVRGAAAVAMRAAAAAVRGAAAAAGGADLADPDVPRDPRDDFGFAHRMWAVRGPFVPRRFRRMENPRQIRGVRAARLNLIEAREANPALRDVAAIQQAVDALRDREIGGHIEPILGRENNLQGENEGLARALERAEDQLNRLRQRLDRLEAVDAQQPVPPQQPAEVQPVQEPWVDQVIDEPLPQLPPIEGYEPEVIQRAEIAELVQRVIGMVRNEAHAEAAANGAQVPDHIEMPHLLNAEAIPGVPDYNQLLPIQVAPFLAELRLLELEWIQRGRDRRARAAVGVAALNPLAEPVIPDPIEPINQIANDVPIEPENVVERDLHRRAQSPIPDEPAAKRNRE